MSTYMEGGEVKKPIETKKRMQTHRDVNKGAWTVEEDAKLAEVIAIHGAKRWNTIAAKAGLNRYGKSCRLRWMNYLRPNIKRGNISDQEEDLILRLHKLLGNRWSLIAGRLPGRTDNEIKNYWNSHLSKKIKQQLKEKDSGGSSGRLGFAADQKRRASRDDVKKMVEVKRSEENTNSTICNFNIEEEEEDHSIMGFNMDDFFDFSNEDPLKLEWISRFVQL